MTAWPDKQRGAALLLTCLLLLSSLAISLTASTQVASFDLRSVSGATAATAAELGAGSALRAVSAALAEQLRNPSTALRWQPCRANSATTQQPEDCPTGNDWLWWPNLAQSSSVTTATARISVVRLVGGEYQLTAETVDRDATRQQRARYRASSLLHELPAAAISGGDAAITALFGLPNSDRPALRTVAHRRNDCALTDTDADAIFYWIDGDCDLSQQPTLGAADAPLLLWVSGSLTLAPGGRIHGLVIHDGDHDAWHLPSQARIDGAAIGTTIPPDTPPASVIYDRLVLEKLQRRLLRVILLHGSWSDY